ncbi:MAG: ribonuclease R, partial [Campylobacteraceae bacterium]|nr:ribonuclease R [Campylobacteraceae bacterium]
MEFNTKSLLVSLVDGADLKDISNDFKKLINDLERKKAIKKDKNGICKLDSNYRIGKIDISMNGTGYLEILGDESKKDLVIEPKDLGGAGKGDLVVAKRIFTNSKRQKGKVVLIAQKGFLTYVGMTKTVNGAVIVQNIKTTLPITTAATQKSLKQLPQGTLLKIDSAAGTIREVLGVLGDPLVDEKISLALFNKEEFFTKQSE